MKQLGKMEERLQATKPKLSAEARSSIEAPADKLRADLNRKAN